MPAHLDLQALLGVLGLASVQLISADQASLARLVQASFVLVSLDLVSAHQSEISLQAVPQVLSERLLDRFFAQQMRQLRVLHLVRSVRAFF